MSGPETPALALRIWQVGALCRAVADALDARFNPVAVRGEISGFSRAASGHCYFSIKDDTGQIRCAMFRRAASLLDFVPRDGELVEVRGRLGVYEARGDLQMIVESLQRAGQGALFLQFLRLKARLEAEGLFEAGRKRPLPVMPRAIGLVWIDLEMTGLKPDSDRIIEVALVVTDASLATIAEAPVWVVHQSDATLAGMDSWNQGTHGRSGLIDKVKASTMDEATVEAAALGTSRRPG